MPTYDTQVDRIYQISANVESMQTTLGGSKLSFLALAVSLTVYATLSATSFSKPAKPGPEPSIPTNTTGIKQTAILYKFILNKELYSLLQNMDKSLMQQLLVVVDYIYVRPSK